MIKWLSLVFNQAHLSFQANQLNTNLKLTYSGSGDDVNWSFRIQVWILRRSVEDFPIENRPKTFPVVFVSPNCKVSFVSHQQIFQSKAERKDSNDQVIFINNLKCKNKWMANLFAISGWQMQITFFKRLFSSFSRKIKYPQRLKDFKYVTKS